MFKFLSVSLKCSQDVLVRFTFAQDGTSGMCAVFSNWPIRVRSSEQQATPQKHCWSNYNSEAVHVDVHPGDLWNAESG